MYLCVWCLLSYCHGHLTNWLRLILCTCHYQLSQSAMCIICISSNRIDCFPGNQAVPPPHRGMRVRSCWARPSSPAAAPQRLQAAEDIAAVATVEWMCSCPRIPMQRYEWICICARECACAPMRVYMCLCWWNVHVLLLSIAAQCKGQCACACANTCVCLWNMLICVNYNLLLRPYIGRITVLIFFICNDRLRVYRSICLPFKEFETLSGNFAILASYVRYARSQFLTISLLPSPVIYLTFCIFISFLVFS